MVITALGISFLATLVTPILLIRFRKRWVAAFNVHRGIREGDGLLAELPRFEAEPLGE